MPLSHSILNLDGYEIEEISGTYPVIIKAKFIKDVACPKCNSKNIRMKDTFIRILRHESIGDRNTMLHLKSHKYKCNECGKYFNQIFPGILKWKRNTEGFRREIFNKHNDGICQSKLAKKFKMGSATVERWYKDFLKRKVSEMENNPIPVVFGIDEHFFTRKDGYATTICDLGNHRIYDVILGRTINTLGGYFSKIENRNRVKVIVMDLSESYRSIIKKYFPNAKIVSDRFHVIRLINYHFIKLWQTIDPIGRKSIGLTKLMRTHEINLKPEQKIKVKKYLAEHPEIKPIYKFKQHICKIMLKKRCTKRMCRRIIPLFIKIVNELQNSLFEPMVTLGNTLESWQEEVVRMWRFSKSNGITEGFHTKMEMISRRAYGFRNFENYRLRVKALCS